MHRSFSREKQTKRVVIVGAGPGGLATAMSESGLASAFSQSTWDESVSLPFPVFDSFVPGVRAWSISSDRRMRSGDAGARCGEMGVEMLRGEPVEEIFAEAMRSLIPNKHRHTWSDMKIPSKKYSCSTFMMYLGIEGRYEDVAHHTFYVQNASVTDGTLAPKGQSTLYKLLPVTHEGEKVDWASETARFRKLAIRQMERRIRTERMITPEGWRDEFGLLKGAAFSMKHSLDQMLHLRPHNRFEDVDSIYLTGGGTHPGSGLPVIFQSARISSKLLLEDLGIEPQWSTSSELAMQNDMMQVAS